MNMTHYREYGIGFTKDIMLFDKSFLTLEQNFIWKRQLKC